LLGSLGSLFHYKRFLSYWMLKSAQFKIYVFFLTRETREGWPLLSVETEAHGDSRSTHERGPSLVGSLGSLCRYKRFLSCIGCSNRPSTKYIFFLTRETRERWPLLSVETEPNRDSRSTYERGPSVVGLLGSFLCRYKRLLPCLGCSNRPSTNYLFPQRSLFQCICPPSLAGSRAGSPCLLI
jgi:hypothetical protein